MLPPVPMLVRALHVIPILIANQVLSQFVAQSILVKDASVTVNVWPQILIHHIVIIQANAFAVETGLFEIF